MAAGQKIRGKDGIIEVTIDGTTEEVPCLTSWTLDVSASLNEDSTACMLSNGDGGTTAGGEWTDSELETKSWTVSCEFLWQKDDAAGTTGIMDATDIGASGAVQLFPNNKTGVGHRVYSGNVLVESVSITSETTSVITASVTLKGSGPLSKALTTA